MDMESKHSSEVISLNEVLSPEYQIDITEASFSGLKEAIFKTKNTILGLKENSEHKGTYVQRLIDLRIRSEYVQCRLEEQEKVILRVKGHSFVNIHDDFTNYSEFLPYWQEGKHKLFCQVCGLSIFFLVQKSQHCRDCGLYAHNTCLPMTKRQCIGRKIRTNPTFVQDICPEKSLPEVNFQCAECFVLFESSSSAPRLCDYTGLYYCKKCHWDSKGVTPARILKNWDFTKVSLCQASKQFLNLMSKKPVIEKSSIDRSLFAVITELAEVRELRKNIVAMRRYLEVCRMASEKKLLFKLWNRKHFLETEEVYTLQDLIDIESGVLLSQLSKIHKLFENHITSDCFLCKAKGHICELCDENDDLIFPFTQGAHSCSVCSCVVHRQCYRAKRSVCPKCARMETRISSVLEEEKEDEN